MTHDVTHSTQYLIKYKSRAILANLQRRLLKLGRLIVLLKHTSAIKKLCSNGNSLFSSTHLLDFNMLMIFSLKIVKRGQKLELTYLYACWIMYCIWGTICKITRKWNAKGGQKLWRSGTQDDTMVTKLVLWSTFSRIFLQRIKHFWYKMAEISFFHHIWSKFTGLETNSSQVETD